MSKRLWLVGLGVLVFVGLLVACGSNYNSSSDGLVLVGSQGSAVIETFSFNLNSGHVSAIANSPNDTGNKTCILNGLPSSIVVDKTGSYAYAIINKNTSCDTASNKSQTGIATFKIGSNGTITATGGFVELSGSPVMMKMDASGKFLFVADGPGGVSVFSVGSGSLTQVGGAVPAPVTNQTPNIVDVAATPTVFPTNGINGVQNAVCSDVGNTPPTSEYLYAVDTVGNQIFEFQVNTSSGALTSVTVGALAPFPTDQVPVGIAVDPCDRFVYVSNSQSNKVSAYTICNGLATQSQNCPTPPDGRLEPITGSPYSLTGSANGAGPIVVDPYGNSVYVLGTLSNTISLLRISPVSGALTVSPSTTATGQKPTAIAIRSDDSWLFVTDYNSATVSQYSVTPATGVLTGQPAIQTDNYPWGVAVR